jgi:hypothetical protein
LGGDDVVGIWGGEGYTAHDGNEHVFFLVERAGVEGMFFTEHSPSEVGEDFRKEFTKWI